MAFLPRCRSHDQPCASLNLPLQMNYYCFTVLSKLKGGAQRARVWKAAAASLSCLKGRSCPTPCSALLDYAARHRRAVAWPVRRQFKCKGMIERRLVTGGAIAHLRMSSPNGALAPSVTCVCTQAHS